MLMFRLCPLIAMPAIGVSAHIYIYFHKTLILVWMRNQSMSYGPSSSVDRRRVPNNRAFFVEKFDAVGAFSV